MECCQALQAKRAEMRRGGAWCVFVMKHIWRYIQPKGHCFWWRGKIFSTKWETFHLNQLGEFLEVSFADSRSCCWGSCWGTIADGLLLMPPTQALPSRALQSHVGLAGEQGQQEGDAASLRGWPAWYCNLANSKYMACLVLYQVGCTVPSWPCTPPLTPLLSNQHRQ